MTPEELIERVAEGMHKKRQASKYGGSAGRSQLGEGTRNAVRRQAREAIKIVGEACAELCTSKVPHYSTNELIEDSTGGKHSGAVYAKSIQSLTQGTKE